MRSVLEEVGAAEVPIVSVYNKCDLLEEADRARLARQEPGAPVRLGADGRRARRAARDGRVAARARYRPRGASVRCRRPGRSSTASARLYRHARVIQHVTHDGRLDRRGGAATGAAATGRGSGVAARRRSATDEARRCQRHRRLSGPSPACALRACRSPRAAACSPSDWPCPRVVRTTRSATQAAVATRTSLFPAAPAGVGDAERAERTSSAAGGSSRRAIWRRPSASSGGASGGAPAFYPAETALGYAQLAHGRHAGGLWRDSIACSERRRRLRARAGRPRRRARWRAGRADEALAAFEAAWRAIPALEAMRRRVEVLRFRVQRETLRRAPGRPPRRATLDDGACRLRAGDRGVAGQRVPLPGARRGRTQGRAVRTRRSDTSAEGGGARPGGRARPWVALGDLLETQRRSRRCRARRSRGRRRSSPARRVAARIADVRPGSRAGVLPAEYQAIAGAAQADARRPGGAHRRAAAVARWRAAPATAGRARHRRARATGRRRGSWPWCGPASWSRTRITRSAPRGVVRRTDLAQAASRVLDLVAARRPARRRAGRRPGRRSPTCRPDTWAIRRRRWWSAPDVMTLDDGRRVPARRAPVSGRGSASARSTRLEELAR